MSRPEPTELSIERETDGAVAVVRASGELDLATAPQLALAISASAAGPRPRVLVDLAAVAFCDSGGLRALLGAAREVEARAGRLVVAVEPGGTVARVLEMAGLTEFLRVRAPAEARAALA
jgi:anti-sigma B factor antagonist